MNELNLSTPGSQTEDLSKCDVCGPVLMPFTVQLHRRGSNTKGRIEVMANGPAHAEQVAVAQAIEISFPNSQPAQWIVTKVEAKPA